MSRMHLLSLAAALVLDLVRRDRAGRCPQGAPVP